MLAVMMGRLGGCSDLKNPEGQLARWLEILSSFKFQIQHLPGLQHRNADALSRLPCRQCGYEPEREDAVCNAAKAIRIEEPCAKMNDLQDKDHDLRLVKSWLVQKVYGGRW